MGKMTNILLTVGTNELEVIEFSLQHPDPNTGEMVTQSFGINVTKVREIMRMPQITPVPGLPSGIVGIFNLRSRIIPALDLAYLLWQYPNTGEDRKMIIAEFSGSQYGFIVNQVYRIHRFSWKQVEPPDIVSEFARENNYIIGIVKTEDRNILMLDVEKIIADLNPTLAVAEVQADITEELPGKGKTIFTAEDSPTIRKLLMSRLELAGYEVRSFHNGEDAWKALEEIANSVSSLPELYKKVNLVVTDIEMPQMDGYTLTKKIKQHPLLQNLPVIIFSSMVTDDVLHKGKSAGADAQLTKPQVSILLDTIQELLKFQAEHLEEAQTA